MELNFLTYLRGLYNADMEKSSEPHFAVIQSIYDEFVIVENDIRKMRLEMSLGTAHGKWLDLWGKLFKVSRNALSDDNYRRKIILKVTNPVISLPRLREIIEEKLMSFGIRLTDEVVIDEMYEFIAKYSENACLSGNTEYDEKRVARFSSYDYSYGRIIIRLTQSGIRPLTDYEMSDLENLVRESVAAGIVASII